MGIGMVPVVMAVPMVMTVVVMMVMRAAERNRGSIGLTGTRAFAHAEIAGLGQTLNMVMVTGLFEADLLFKTQHLSPVFAERAVHCDVTSQHLLNPLQKRVQHEVVIAQIRGIDEINLGVIVRDAFGVLSDPTDQHPREEEVGEHHDALESKLHHVTQARLHQREGDA